MSFHLSTSFGVVPEPIKAWKPEMAPQAMVMEMKGQTGPPNTGPPPWTNWVMAGNWISGLMQITPITSAPNTPIFIKLEM